MKVRATTKYKELNLKSQELKYVPEDGEEFEVTEEKFRVLSGENKYKAVFVTEVKEAESIKKAIKVRKTKK